MNIRILYDVRAAAEALSMGRTLLFREIKSGHIKPLRHHPKVLFHESLTMTSSCAVRGSVSRIAFSSPAESTGFSRTVFGAVTVAFWVRKRCFELLSSEMTNEMLSFS